MNSYKTQIPPRLKEYGRIIEDMVCYAITLPSKEERQQCAQTIVDTMLKLVAKKKNDEEAIQKSWEYLAFLANYQLDIDYPCEIRQIEQEKAPKLPYPNESFQFRHYGSYTEKLVEAWEKMPEGEEKESLLKLLLFQMKKALKNWNPDVMSDLKIAKDIERFTKGNSVLTEEEVAQLTYISKAEKKKGKFKNPRNKF